jgi:lysophospholipase L1-like esterase
MFDAEDTPKKHILCYGDSNTWGYVPGGDGQRLPSAVRWPGVLSKLLRANYHVTEEGLNGRTTVWDDPFSPSIERNGGKTLGAILETHRPLDLVIIMLGTNDLKRHFSATPDGIAKGVEMLVHAAYSPAYGPGNGAPPAILVICPCSIWEVADASFGDVFADGGREKSLLLRAAFRRMQKRVGMPLMYAEDFVASDTTDGIHLSAESHGILAQEVAKWILDWFEKHP